MADLKDAIMLEQRVGTRSCSSTIPFILEKNGMSGTGTECPERM